MREIDSLQRFIFEHAHIRGEIVHINNTFKTIMSQRNYPPRVKIMLAEAMVSCLLLTSSIKFEGSLSLQFQGDKRLSLILVQCDHDLNIRALAQFEESLTDEDYDKAFLTGKMMLTINQDAQAQTYQSMVSIESSEMSENLMNYFAQSEQITTGVWLAVNDDCAAGLLLQLMPSDASIEREQFWEYAVQLGQTVTEEELLTLDNQTLLYRLYNETELRLFDSRPTQFKCRCTPDKMKQVVRVLGEQDALELLKSRKELEVTCDFCNQSYGFDPIDVALIFKET
ncbi:MAG: Hsp33 family molecular chaperone HslO [Legionella sp.]|nr:Hsp33 family molecular chaperone HslO [Legionella sp.]